MKSTLYNSNDIWFFVDYKQKNQLEQLVIVEFVVDNKIYSVTKMSLFIANYRRELRMEVDIRKEKVKKAIEFVERIKGVQEKAKIVLKKAQKKIKRQVDKGSVRITKLGHEFFLISFLFYFFFSFYFILRTRIRVSIIL